MGTAPPARCIGRVTAVGSPGICFVFFQAVVQADILREADCLEYAAVLAAGEHVSALIFMVDVGYATYHEFILGQLGFNQLIPAGDNEVTPDQRLIRNRRMLSGRNAGHGCDFKMFIQELLAGILDVRLIIEQMERIAVCIFRIDTVSCEAAAQTVGTVMHHGDGADDFSAIGTASVLVEDA